MQSVLLRTALNAEAYEQVSEQLRTLAGSVTFGSQGYAGSQLGHWRVQDVYHPVYGVGPEEDLSESVVEIYVDAMSETGWLDRYAEEDQRYLWRRHDEYDVAGT